MEREELAAKIEVHDAICTLAHIGDTGTIQDYLDCFTTDAVLEIPGQAVLRGRAALEDRRREVRDAGRFGPGSNSRHLLTTIVVTIDGDVATGRTSFLLLRNTVEAPTIDLTGEYRDTLRRTPAGWKIAHRVIQFG